MKKDERIAILKQHDDAQAAMDGIMLGDAGLTTGTNAVSKRTKHCPYRLINFLFSDEFATRYSQTGDTASRAALDSKQTNAKSNFWQEVREGIDPSVTKPHPPEKLFAMAKELTQKYFAAEQRFTKCGQHENEFRNFVENQERGALSQRSQLLNILGDIRRHLGDIDKS
ncbi:uncharacterized protein KRP23_14591 [Phytophthora ramorum]|uniref:uncharacterized protein n=1 Tax=Phytophthora ramorum TaxID=164328 RepID=UPI0030A10373|nr:hypothetical protein KRP23_14591 [Phytophthora ramorum]